MKTLKRILLCLIILSSIFSVQIFLPENFVPSTYIVDASSIRINKTSKTMCVSDTYTLKISGTKKTVKWSSSNKNIATVNSKGKVTAKRKGKVTITAKVNNRKYKCVITVKNSSSIYITRTGKKYHRSNCRCLAKSKIKISLSKAKNQGYTACKICKP